ncbi:MAG: glycosyltransferase family 4 protein [Candidatus Levybacteria bacterium]|nr:glycosyltransferase family 4 protein [Candidatus Levybacteria bacterium]
MKIAIFHELDFGGARRTVEEFAKRLNKILDVDLYYVDNKEDKNAKKISRRDFFYPFYPKTWKGNNWKTRLYKDTLELYRLYNLHKKIAKDIESKEYDYIFVHPSKFTQAPFLLRFLKNKCIYFCQEPLRIIYDKNLSDLSFVRFHKKLYEFIIRKIRKRIDLKNLNSAKMILANSKFSKESIEKAYGKKVVICYLGVDTNLFKPLNLNKTIDVLFIGNKDNGYDLLDKLSKHFNNCIKARAVFRGNSRVSHTDEELIEIYNKSKVLVALNRNEPFGLIPLEAMACGVPVIAVGEGGYSESVVNDKTGFLIPRNPSKLYEKINEIISNEKLRKEMSKNARDHVVKNWSWDKSIKNFLEIIKYEKR